MTLPTIWQALQTPDGWTATKTVDKEMFFQHIHGQVLSLEYQNHMCLLRQQHEVLCGGSDFFNLLDPASAVQHPYPHFYTSFGTKPLLRWQTNTVRTSAQEFGQMLYENLGPKMIDRAQALAHVLAKTFDISNGYWSANDSHLIFDEHNNSYDLLMSYEVDLYDFLLENEWYILTNSGFFEQISSFKIVPYHSHHFAMQRQDDIDWVLERMPTLKALYHG